ncbi:MAG: hypothetical protein Ct9H300mP21_03250 [Pseudomonadota bacterium]|nr:MAG: hypothetical protein Ct9H300mP21_03250 [Pseudomonadota bacterium]
MHDSFETGLPQNSANYTPLSPITFLKRTAFVHPHRTSVIHGKHRWPLGRNIHPILQIWLQP